MGLFALLHRPQSLKGRDSSRPVPDIAAPAFPGVVTFQRPGGPIADHLEVLDPGQIGAGSMAGVHVGSVTAPGASPDPRRTQYVQTVGDALIPPNPRRFSAMSGGRNTTPAVPEGYMDGPDVLETPAHIGPADNWVGSNAVPDPRRVWQDQNDGAKQAGYPLAEVRPVFESNANAPQLEGDSGYLGTYDETRNRAGAAPADSGRPAQVRTPIFQRPFDKLAADTLSGQKGVFRSPLASTPIQETQDVANHVPSPGGWRASSGVRAVVAPSASTYRQAPAPYDATMVDAGAAPYPSTRTSWRAR